MRDDPERAVRLLGNKSDRVGTSGRLLDADAGDGRLDEPAVAPRIRQPTLILAGDDDPIVPLVNARIMATLIPDARLHVYHDGHSRWSPTPPRWFR